MEPEAIIVQAEVAVRGHAVDLVPARLGPRFVRYLTAFTLSSYGDWFTTVALVVLLYRLSGPAAPAGYMVARVLPRILGGGAGGALADRFRPNYVVAACAVIQALATVAIIPEARIHATWAVFGSVVLAQFGGGLARPGLGALVPRVAPEQRLQSANALANLGFSTSIAVAPAIAAPLLSATGPETLIAIDAVTFIVAAGLMLTLRVPRRAPDAAPVAGRGVMAGARATWADPRLRTLAASWLCSATAVTTASALLVLIAGAYGDTSRVGYLYGAVGAGSVAMAVGALRLRPRVVPRDLIVGLAVADVLCLALITLRGPFGLTLLLLALNGAAGVAWQTWGATEVQLRANPAFLGRINAVMVTSSSVGMLIGGVLALVLVDALGWQHTLFTGCCAALALLAAGVVFGPQAASSD